MYVMHSINNFETYPIAWYHKAEEPRMSVTGIGHALKVLSKPLGNQGGVMKVIDVMEYLNYWLTPEMNLLEAIAVMKQAKRGHGLSVNAIVVLDGDKKLVGIVSTTDILRTILPPGMYLDEGPDGSDSWDGLRIDRIRQAKNTTVGQIMTEDVRTIKTDESIMRCADRLLVEQLRRLPVVARDGRVVGMVYLRDVYNRITGILCEPAMVAIP